MSIWYILLFQEKAATLKNVREKIDKEIQEETQNAKVNKELAIK